MPAIVPLGQSFVDVSRSTGSLGMSGGRRGLLSDLRDQCQIRHYKTRNKKEGFQSFPQSLGQLGALKPSLPIPPVAVVPERWLNFSGVPHSVSLGCQATSSGVSVKHARAQRVMRHSSEAALLVWREPSICGEDMSWP